jgi:hypothetical protein
MYLFVWCCIIAKESAASLTHSRNMPFQVKCDNISFLKNNQSNKFSKVLALASVVNSFAVVFIRNRLYAKFMLNECKLYFRRDPTLACFSFDTVCVFNYQLCPMPEATRVRSVLQAGSILTFGPLIARW